MLYFIKFIYTTFLLPPGFLIIIFALFCFWLFRRDRKAAVILAVIIFIFYILSTPFLSDPLTRSLEYKYRPPLSINGDVIVMLGGGATSDTPDLDGQGHLSGHAANRLITTVRLYRITGLPVIISGGKVYSNTGNESLIAKRQLIGLGVPEEKIITEDRSLNTEQNALYIKQIMQQYKFKKPVLVTSASHMRRAVLNFDKIGVDTTPYPTDYKANSNFEFSAGMLVPSASEILDTSIIIKEYLGIWALRF
ncbi:MAG TPA: YdcF family protein [Desulfotomaculum sp.]|nr:MAG: Uncharacterized protein XD78_0070 [Desulfotomaculum sp. 46_296]HAG10164.1 YdcF family protein [Desulfotomaculum sp.]HBY04993.1 YdcF family protein [Desulfotomaculum sp.]